MHPAAAVGGVGVGGAAVGGGVGVGGAAVGGGVGVVGGAAVFAVLHPSCVALR